MALPDPVHILSQSVNPGCEAPPRLSASGKQLDPQVVEELSRYIAQMSGELASMARSVRQDLLAYFLDMARVEATSRGRKPGERDRA